MSVFGNIKALGKRGYDVNVTNGFWEGERNIGEMIALIQSELSEAFIALDTSAMDDKLPQFPGQITELADVVIRLADYSEGFDKQIFDYLDTLIEYNNVKWQDLMSCLATDDLNIELAGEWYEYYLYMNAACSMVLEVSRKPEKFQPINGVPADVHYLAVCAWLVCMYIYDNCDYEGMSDDEATNAIDYLTFVMKCKIDYNATRGYKHGKKF